MDTQVKNQGDNRIIPAKKDQLVHFVEKSWGHEEWIANNDKYCGKKLVVRRGFRCSMHQHKIKDETFYLASGKMLLEMEFEGELSERVSTQRVLTQRVLMPGDVQHIKIGLWHRFTALEDSELFEFSTFHMDSDSYRREIGGAVEL